MINNIFFDISVVASILVLVFLVSGILYARVIAWKLTQKIVYIFETLDFVLKQQSKRKDFVLKFTPSNKELNEL